MKIHTQEQKTKRTQALLLLKKGKYTPADFLDWAEGNGMFDEASDVDNEANFVMKFLEEKKFLAINADGTYTLS